MKQYKSTHYVPILRWKRAEQVALSQLFESDSICITPLIELIPDNIIKKGKAGKEDSILELDVATNNIIEQLVKYWGPRPFFIDLLWLASDILKQRTGYFLEILSQCASIYSLCFIPVTGLSRDAIYQTSVEKVTSMHHQGACLRLFIDDIKSLTLKRDIDTLLKILKLEPESVDIIVDFQITDQHAPTFDTLCYLIPNINKWRNFIVASGAFPEDLSKLHKNDVHYLDRTDWISWKDQVTSKTLPRTPIYSDYAIQHARYIRREGLLFPSASIRYTSDDSWIIMRGEAIKREGEGPGSAQWQDNAILLCDLPEYCNLTFSKGDKYIKEISLQHKETGSTETWLRAGINHHITFVVRQIANLSGISIGA